MSTSIDDPRNVRTEDFSGSDPIQTQMRYLLNYAVLAPSTLNSQPWLFRVSGSSIFLYVDRTRALAAVDPIGRGLIMSCGAAQYNLTRALMAFGYEFHVSLFPDMAEPDLLSRIDIIRRRPVEVDRGVISAIKNRRMVRSGFDSPVKENGLLSSISAAVSTQMGSLTRMTGQQVDTLTRGEGLSTTTEQRFPFFGKQGEEVSIAVLATRGDRIASWLRAGLSMEAGLLRASELNIGVATVSIDALRPHVTQVLELRDKSYPQVLMRFGYSEPPQPTERRSVVDVMRHPGYAR